MVYAIDTLVSVIVGAAIGLLSSMGYEWWIERRREAKEKGELIVKIREELQHIQKEIIDYSKREEIESRSFSTEVFQALKQDFIRRIDVATFRAVQNAYSKIEELKTPSPVIRGTFYEALQHIEAALDALGRSI